MSELNDLIKEKIKKYPKNVQQVILKVLELAKNNNETAISEQLEGIVRDIIK